MGDVTRLVGTTQRGHAGPFVSSISGTLDRGDLAKDCSGVTVDTRTDPILAGERGEIGSLPQGTLDAGTVAGIVVAAAARRGVAGMLAHVVLDVRDLGDIMPTAVERHAERGVVAKCILAFAAKLGDLQSGMLALCLRSGNLKEFCAGCIIIAKSAKNRREVSRCCNHCWEIGRAHV